MMVADGKWHHIVSMWDGSTITHYIDGALDRQSGSATGSLVQGSTNNAYIGKSGISSAIGYFAGLIDHVRLYNRGLTAQEVSDRYYLGKNIASGLIGEWKFDEGSGTSATDSAGTNTGTITAATYSTDVFMKARTSVPTTGFLLALQGSGGASGNGFLTIPTNTALNLSGDFTLEAWVKPSQWADYQFLMDKKSAGGHMYFCGINASAQLQFTSLVSSASITAGLISHLAFVYNSTTTTGYIFMNGTLMASGTPGLATPDNSSSMYLLTNPDNPGAHSWRGGVDEMRLSNTQRYTGTTIGTNYFTPSTTPFTSDANTVLLMHFDEGKGSIAKDASSNALTATFGGSDLTWISSFKGGSRLPAQ